MQRHDWLLVAAAGATIIGALSSCGSERTPIPPEITIPDQDISDPVNDDYPQFISFCDPDNPGVRVYLTAKVWDGQRGAGAAIAVIPDKECHPGGNIDRYTEDY